MTADHVNPQAKSGCDHLEHLQLLYAVRVPRTKDGYTVAGGVPGTILRRRSDDYVTSRMSFRGQRFTINVDLNNVARS